MLYPTELRALDFDKPLYINDLRVLCRWRPLGIRRVRRRCARCIRCLADRHDRSRRGKPTEALVGVWLDYAQIILGRGRDVLVVGTLLPGPMLDAWEQRSIGPQPVIAPWSLRGTPAGGHVTQAASGSSPVVDR